MAYSIPIRALVIATLSTWIFCTTHEAQQRLLARCIGPITAIFYAKPYKQVDHAKFKILAIWRRGPGEQEWAARAKIAAERLGYEFRYATEYHDGSFIGKYTTDPVNIAIKAMRPDVILSLQITSKVYRGAQNYRVLDADYRNFFDTNIDGTINLQDYLLKYDGYLVSFPEMSLLQQKLAEKNAKYHGMVWYPTVYKTDYQPAIPQRLFYAGGFDNYRTSTKYMRLFAMLDAHGYIDMPRKRTGALNSYTKGLRNVRKMIPFDGVTYLVEVRKNGIELVLHSQRHLFSGVPTGRIFEAAAANVVIISDTNDFVKRNFGANVLYIDMTREADEIFTQIEQYMQWIKANPAKAQAMADKCHQIFLQKFVLEDQLVRLKQLCESKKIARTFPLPGAVQNSFSQQIL